MIPPIGVRTLAGALMPEYTDQVVCEGDGHIQVLIASLARRRAIMIVEVLPDGTEIILVVKF